MTESRNVQVELQIAMTRGTWLALSAAGAMLVAGILASVALGVGWMSTAADGEELDYTLSRLEGGGASIEYDALDRASQGQFDGIGMITTARVLAIIGTVLAFVSVAVLALSLFARRFRLTLAGSLVAGLAAVVLVLVTIFAPLGISSLHGDLMADEPSTSLEWGAGLILGILMAVFAIAGTVLGFLALRDPQVT